MLEIPLSDLADWYSTKVKKQVEPVRKKTQKIIEKIQQGLVDINSSCEKFSEITTVSERDELTSKSIENLANKYQARIKEIELPQEPLIYEKVTKFAQSLKGALEYMWQIGRRWIPKLSRASGQTYKMNIRELDYHMKNLHAEWGTLERLIDKDLKKIKVYEDIFDEIEKMKTILQDLNTLKEEMKTLESNLSQLNAKKDLYSEKYSDINKNPLISERKKIDNEISVIIQNLKGELGYFRKPLRKFEKFLGEGNYFVRPGCTDQLTKYINNPLETFFAETEEYPNLKMVMAELKKAIPRLKLKPRDEKKLEKEIDDINGGSFLGYRRNYNQLSQKFQEISQSLKEEGLLEELEAIQNDITQVQREISEFEQKYSRVKDNYDRTLIKIRDGRKNLEQEILSTTKEEIKINF